jgi:tRNA(Ile)-lysidine synthase
MTDRLDPVHRELGRFLRAEGVSRTSPVLAAVSGGADSMALLHALLALGQKVGAAHVHHGLRGAEADRDQAFVADECRALGVPFFAARVAARQRDGRSPEARARALRYAALEELRVAHGYARLATAHHRDDQAETVLLRALRGTGPAGLAAIRPTLDGGRVLRPLLGLRRAELAAYLARGGHRFVSDSTNAEPAIPRNRLRAEVVPLLEAIAPGAVANLAALAELARESELVTGERLDALLAGAVETGEGGVWLEVETFAALAPAAARRALAHVAARAGLGEHRSRAELARIERFLREARPGQRLALAGRAALYRDRGRVWLGPGEGPRFPPPVEHSLAAGETLEFPERRIRLSWRATSPDSPSPDPLRFPARPGDCFTVRSARDADRLEMRGADRRLKDVLANARWSKLERARALVLEQSGAIVWVPGLLWGPRSKGLDPARFEIRAERL